MNRTHAYKEKFPKECKTSVIYLSVYIRFIRANDLNLNSQCTGRLAELSKVENSISPDILGPCHIDQVIGTTFPGFRSLLLFQNLKILFKFLKTPFLNRSTFSTDFFRGSHRTAEYSEYSGGFTFQQQGIIGVGIKPVGWVQVTRCQNATGNLSFIWQKGTKLINFTLITFAVYEREQNFCPKFQRSHIQCKIIDSDPK